MNSVMETYLTFKVDNVIDYINILFDNKKILTKLPKNLNRLIYKYYDLFILSKKEVNYDKIKLKTGLDDTEERLILFYLLIEFDIASKTELSKEMYYNFYNFIVNLVIIFIELEKYVSKKEQVSYDDSMTKTLKKYDLYLPAEHLLLIDDNYHLLKKLYNKNQTKEQKFKQSLEFEKFNLTLSKIKNSSNLYISKFKYKNDKLDKENKKDVELVNNEFATKLNFINIEMLQQRLIEEVFTENKKQIFIYLEDEIITKKINLSELEKCFKLKFLKNRIYLLVNTSLLEKYEDRINYLIDKEYNIAYYKNSEIVNKNIFEKKTYLFVTFENLEIEKNTLKDNKLELIVRIKNRLPDKEFKKIDKIKYISW